jgi:hypothetical protein
MQVILSVSAERFSSEVQEKFRQAFAVASSTGCKCEITEEDVNITSFSDAIRRLPVGRPPSRSLQSTSESIKADVHIAVADPQQGNMLVPYLTIENMNRELKMMGLPPITEISESPRVIGGTSAAGTWSGVEIAGFTIGCTTIIVMVGFGVVSFGSNRIAAADNVLDPELTTKVREAVEKMLAEEQRQDGRLVGGMKDFQSGQFRDAAKGIKSFIGVDKAWHQAKECTTDGIIAEVKRVCNCPYCAEVQAGVLTDMKRDKEGELTKRLATELLDLQRAETKQEPAELQKEKIAATRAKIEALDGWVYGSDKSKPVNWPADTVAHQWGEYGQPMCETCKGLSLDFSTIWADLCYILCEITSEKMCFNGIRDHGRAGMKLDDFMNLTEVKEADLSEAELVALRFYTSHSFHSINRALRARQQPHPLPATVMCINNGLKKLCALDAESDEATEIVRFFRGFTDMQVAEDFRKKGGSEYAPMSTTKDYLVACGYAVRKGESNGSLLMVLVTTNNLQRGSDLTFLSMFPDEAETLFPPLTFVQPTGKEQVIECIQGALKFELKIIEVKTTLPFSSS